MMPEIIYKEEYLLTIDCVDNRLVTENYFADKNIFIGKGVGAVPTAAAVLSELSALTYNYKYEYKKKQYANKLLINNDYFVNVYIRFDRDCKILLTQIEEIYENHD